MYRPLPYGKPHWYDEAASPPAITKPAQNAGSAATAHREEHTNLDHHCCRRHPDEQPLPALPGFIQGLAEEQIDGRHNDG